MRAGRVVRDAQSSIPGRDAQSGTRSRGHNQKMKAHFWCAFSFNILHFFTRVFFKKTFHCNSGYLLDTEEPLFSSVNLFYYQPHDI